ncbi:tyrosine-type recombinase/integrase [Muricomes intestini]|jgi:integrase|uniref:tyrosine-type recombinase/integrase n=1 Tax=Muricomes intestini TaxID=1796634 RepID=UPI000E812792|nr:hypothetical protein [Lachnospiraceae bacterium]HCR82181.1 hypothetical protein [Lachnospiraceae bacterium]
MKTEVKFESCLKEEMTAYLTLRASQGKQSKKVRHIFVSLDKYLQGNELCEKALLPHSIDGWLSSLPNELNVNTVNVYITYYIQFAKYLRSLGYIAFIPDKSIGNRNYIPYIFCKDELFALVKSADDMVVSTPPKYRRNAACFIVMIRMLIGCGFRINEVRLLKTKDVNLDRGIIYIKSAKGNRDRLVPLHESLTEILRVFAKSGIPQSDGCFFTDVNGMPITYSWIRERFNKCLEQINIERPKLPRHSRNICLHCLRHSYAVVALRKLDMDGIDLYSEIPILSTYMGHENLYGTEHYLHMTVENSQDIRYKMDEFNKGLFPEVAE